jgi:hypothetical protein
MNTSRLAQLGEAAGFFVPEWIVFFGGIKIFYSNNAVDIFSL